ncbi:MAG: 3'-5' exonuclease [Actinobacteria bacterium]|nr:3'-5' exonuclease [Actinomycetota bacterium]
MTESATQAPSPEHSRAGGASPWHLGILVGFDLETTGTDPMTARTVTAAVVYVRSDGTVDPRSQRWLVDPGVPIPDQATAVHGITTEHARAHGVPVDVAVGEIASALQRAWQAGLPIVVFNAAYDLTLLEASLARHGLPGLASRDGWASAAIIDPLVIDRAVDRYRRGKRTLQVAAEHYRVAATDAHSADGDAIAACLVARSIASAYPEVGNAPVDALHRQQAEWSRVWATHFQAYVRSRGDASAVIDGTWPLRLK